MDGIASLAKTANPIRVRSQEVVVSSSQYLPSSAVVKDYQMPADRARPCGLHQRLGQASDNTQGRKPRGRSHCRWVVSTELWGFEEQLFRLFASR